MKNINPIPLNEIYDISILPYNKVRYEAHIISNGKQDVIYSDDWSDFGFKTLHRTDGPAYIEFNKDGLPIKIEFWQNGLLHRENEPAVIACFVNNFNKLYVQALRYYKNGMIHTYSEDKPMLLYDLQSNMLNEESYYKNGLLHNLNGPAIIKYNNSSYNGISISKHEEYYINNKKLSLEMYKKIIFKMKLDNIKD